MVNEKMRPVQFSILNIFLAALIISLVGCASTGGGRKKVQVAEDADQLKYIKNINVSEQGNASPSVLIEGDRLLTYTSIKQPYPLSVILYFPETDLDLSDVSFEPESDIIESVKASQLAEKPHTSRVEILLKKDTSYEVERDENALRVLFDKGEATPEETDAFADEAPAEGMQMPADEAEMNEDGPASQLESVYASKFTDNVKINLNADGQIKDYKVFALKNPPRIVFDVLNIASTFKKEQVIQIDEEWVKRVRYFSYPDRLRLVIDTKDEYLEAFSAIPTESGMTIQVGSVDKDAPRPIIASVQTGNDNAEQEPSATNKPAQGNIRPAWINRIEFTSEEKGRSSILIGTTQPVEYEVTKDSDKKINLLLKNAKVPKYRQRPLITTRFESAVDRVMPVSVPSAKNDSIIVMELRESVPYFIEQKGNILTVQFEASAIAPKPEDEADLPSWKKVLDEAVVTGGQKAAHVPEVTAGGQKIEDMGASETPIEASGETGPEGEGKDRLYTGKKIALDFYKTDIQNVFRILRDVSGKNFAIEKDVAGKVTMALDKPVPWDQVLDLVLKMNQLGMVYEGDIIRIATLETLKAEEQLRQENLVARQKSNEQEKSLEPLVTEYIPINYSNAEEDIKAHLEMILTKDRGSVSVDKRTNQIIMVDVQDKIDRAKEIVKKLDKVTPQVIIEARVVEASTSFAKELGTEWQVLSEDVYNSDLKGAYGFDIAMNNAMASSTGSLGFNFSKIVGTPYVLNAKLTAMETQGQGKIISSPKIVTLDNNKATIKQGIEYPYQVVDDGDIEIKFKPIDLLLEVTPHVTMDNRIAINIKITKNDIYQETSPPSLTTKEVETELLINDGDTIVIGGIIKTNKRDLEQGFPILSRIPVLGFLFKSKVNSDEKEELLIFLTPTIVQLEQPHI
ncbi:MAG: type IV pilus secretin PilQ [Proteobacteria bacterium]|nr:type IV pilus secretin PilQ [Pseudomonadota bacterium]